MFPLAADMVMRAFSAKAGQTIGIIGGTGSGKSSLVNMIPRCYDATKGEIKIFGKNIKEYDTGNLRDHIGMVLQKAVLFKGTIADNLRWGKEDATEEEMDEALMISQAKEFVDNKVGRLEFGIEQGGRNLSGGQKQRLTIARALVRRPEILILDDSASALDFATDAALRMAIHDMKERFARIIVGYTYDNKPVTAGDIHAQGAMTALMKDALKPNLVQTLEHVPAFIHGGPFANIAHGCNSVLATRTALHLADYVVTEAGFGADLGAEKFLDIKCRFAGLKPDAAVLVATIRALKMNGGKAKNELTESDPEAVKRGLPNLLRHMHNLKKYGLPIVVALNMFPSDTEEEKKVAFEACKEAGVPVAESTVFADGGEGGLDLGEKVLAAIDQGSNYKPLYDLDLSLKEKIETIAKEIYGADGVAFDGAAAKELAHIEEMGYGKMPVCIAKTPVSFSDDPSKLGAPSGFTLHVREVKVSAGAGFVVALTGKIMTMPGLPRRPAAERIDVDDEGNITGLF